MKRVQLKIKNQKPDLDGNSISTGKPEEAKRKTSAFNWKLADRVAKLLVILLILLLCWNVIPTTVSAPSARADKGATQTQSRDNQQIVEFTHGNWSFGDGDWDLRVFPETKNNSLLDPPTFQRDRSPQFDDSQYIEMLRNLGAKPKPLANGFELWQSENSGGPPVVMFTRGTIIQLLRTQFSTGNGISIIEGRPRSSQPKEATVLLPLTGGVKQIASRTDDHQQLVSAVLEVGKGYASDIRVVWGQQGWNVEPLVGLASPNGGENAQAARYRCTKDGNVVEATFFLDQSGQPSQILLTQHAFGSD